MKTRKPLGPCSGLPTWFKNCIASRESMTVQSFEEKKTDVNIATYLLKDAYEGNVDVAVVISNDSDLCEPLRICKEELGIIVVAVNPVSNSMRKQARFNQLKYVSSRSYELHSSAIRLNQMPATIKRDGNTVTKPAGW